MGNACEELSTPRHGKGVMVRPGKRSTGQRCFAARGAGPSRGRAAVGIARPEIKTGWTCHPVSLVVVVVVRLGGLALATALREGTETQA